MTDTVFLNYYSPSIVGGGSLQDKQDKADISAEIEIPFAPDYHTVGAIHNYIPNERKMAFGFATLAFYLEEDFMKPIVERKRNAHFGFWCEDAYDEHTRLHAKVTLATKVFGGCKAEPVLNSAIRYVSDQVKLLDDASISQT
ncbi:hypothetical protein WNY37_14200 [Henriciella sp. AS95]|uniref:hypothetical protein n=1 Tax=Henriciella sp. AS95 TaxID=3135782 RepID=UPI003181D613